MAYQYKGPSLAAGGTLVKANGKRVADKQQRKANAPTANAPRAPRQEPERQSIFTPEEWAERLAPGWDERGWHGGGECKIRNMKQRRRPSKGNTRTGRQAHPSLLRVTR
jgi:hypothetical protein